VDLPSGERGSYNKTCLTSSDSACEDINIKVEDTEVKVGKIPLPLLYHRIKVEPDEVSYMSLYSLLVAVFVISVLLLTHIKRFHCDELELFKSQQILGGF
jgi:hypothetical protein